MYAFTLLKKAIDSFLIARRRAHLFVLLAAVRADEMDLSHLIHSLLLLQSEPPC